MSESIYTPGNRTCPCKGTGLIPPSPVKKGMVQAYCPVHVIERTWPQLQKDGSVIFKRINIKGIIEKD